VFRRLCQTASLLTSACYSRSPLHGQPQRCRCIVPDKSTLKPSADAWRECRLTPGTRGGSEVVRRVGEQGASAGGQTASERIYGEISKDR
jgi:hypothetical protein